METNVTSGKPRSEKYERSLKTRKAAWPDPTGPARMMSLPIAVEDRPDARDMPPVSSRHDRQRTVDRTKALNNHVSAAGLQAACEAALIAERQRPGFRWR
jgi:hypothetical protein